MSENNVASKERRRTIGTVAQRVVRMRRQSRYGRPIQAVWKVFQEYSEGSTVHGVRYLGEHQRHWSERIWWIMAVSVSVFLCFGFIFKAWWKWSTSPVIITFADEATPISNIPFPTLTICNDDLVNTTVFNYTSIWDKLSNENYMDADLNEETVRKLYSLTNFCNQSPYYLENYIKNKNFTIDRNNIMVHLEKVTPNLTAVFQLGSCALATTRVIPCEMLMKPTLTDSGVCHTFNHLSSFDIYNTDQLADDFPKISGFSISHWQLTNFTRNGTLEMLNQTYPYQISNSGKGLEIKLIVPRAENDNDLCSAVLEGFKIQIHSGDEIPRMKQRFHHIPFDHDVRIFVRPNLMVTSPSLIKNYQQKQRKCIDQNEHNLHFFKKYTQRNCLLDILAIKMPEICGCAQFWMPRHNDTNICYSHNSFQCIEFVEKFIYSANLTNSCLPVCDSTTYDVEISISKIKSKALRRLVSKGNRVIRLSILFKDQQYFASHRSELYGTMDFIAQCGGILSLFMGISILSFVEIIYFATLRLSCKLHKRKLTKKRLQAQQNTIECITSPTR